MKNNRMPEPDTNNLMTILINTWRRFRKEAGPNDKLQTREFRSLVSAVEKLESKKDLYGNYFSDPELLGAHLLYYWIIHYQQGLTLLNELPITPKRVLDVCSGAMPFAFAALRHGSKEVFATDQNAVALDLGASVCGKYGVTVSGRRWDCLKETCPIDGQFDLIILAHCLEELFSNKDPNWSEKQDNFISNMLKRLTPEGFLLIVDSSKMESNKRILQIRDIMVRKGIPIQAPCVWKGDCPALQAKNSPCYAQRELEKPYLIKEIQRANQINLNSLKMSYIIFRHPLADWPKIPNIPLYRIVSPPIETFHGNRYYICGTDGKKNLGSNVKNHSVDSRAFEFLRRGELISIENAFQKGQILDVIEGTKISVQAACGKAILENNKNVD